MKKHQGYILLFVLLFLQAFSALSLYTLSALSSYIKSTRHLQQKYQHLLIEKQILQKLEADIPTLPPACFVEISTVTWINRSESGWQQTACFETYQGYPYAYAVEFLDTNNCAFTDSNHILTAAYYRITVKLLAAPRLLQSIVIYPKRSSDTCKGEKHQVVPGRQMWREL
ncbi:MAG: hypothetical protein WAW86_01335 [Gammaproteobacteria bacterium]